MIIRIKPLAFLLLFLLSPLAAMAHTHLERAAPKENAVLESAPGNITLSFSNRIEPKFSHIKVTNSEGKFVHDGDTSTSEDQRELSTKLIEGLGAGTYEVHWNVISDDGHRMRGDYSFSVK
ncbi:MAG: copper homeostasis periplasmic binding protein CopC [Chromatiales bacterium]|jgi:methionine-rich copper-binding protein CopC|nr:copper homeostasis periplasmic binding protein CopC [Chromatiales bacterium]